MVYLFRLQHESFFEHEYCSKKHVNSQQHPLPSVFNLRSMNTGTAYYIIVFFLHAFLHQEVLGFLLPSSQGGGGVMRSTHIAPSTNSRPSLQPSSSLLMAQISEAQAKKSIDKVVSALRRDTKAKSELGNLTKVNNILGYGSPKAGTIAVRFNASFQKGGKGLSSVPLPFGMGQSNVSEGRGTMVGQVKASLEESSGKILDCSVFRDLGYGRAFNLKV